MKTALSPIIAGTMNWGVWDKNLNTSEMANLIHVCHENKITTFDHADIYGGYTTEASFGKALTESKIGREKSSLFLSVASSIFLKIERIESNIMIIRKTILFGL